MRGHKLFVLLVFMTVIVSTVRCQGFDQLGQPYETRCESIWCRLWKTIASFLRWEEWVACVSCDEDTECSYTDYVHNIWKFLRNATVYTISEYYAHGLPDRLTGTRLNELLSEFLLGSLLLTTIVFVVYSTFWIRFHNIYDVLSVSYQDSPNDSPMLEAFGLVELLNTDIIDNTVCQHTTYDSDEAEFFEMDWSPCSTETITESESLDEVTNTTLDETEVTPSDVDELNDIQDDGVNSEQILHGEDLPGGLNNVSGDSVWTSQSFQPVRPSPPTVKVFSLHKPEQIPNDVMDSLLCLQKDCEHDHSKVRLIGQKVIVYASSVQYQAQPERLRKTRADQRIAMSRALGLKYLSDAFDDTTSTVATQTETIETPTTLVIRTEAFMRGEGTNPYIEYPKGSMTGTLLIAKDSFETKIVRGSWSQTHVPAKSSPTTMLNGTLSTVRENIAKSRIEIAEFEGHLDGLNFELGNFRLDDPFPTAHSPETVSNPINPSLEMAGAPLKNAVAISSLTTIPCIQHQRSSSMFGADSRGFTSCISHQRSTNPCELKPGRQSLVEFSKNISAMGSQTSFYEKLSLLVAGYAFHKYTQSYSRSVPELYENDPSTLRMSRTL